MWRGWVLVGAVTLGVGCQGKLVTITISESATTTVTKGTILEQLVGDLGFDEFLDMDITESSELANQGVEPGDVKDVRLTAFELEATDPEGADLSFLEAMDLSVEAPGIESALLASASDFPEGQALVVFDVTEADITEHVVSQSMTLTTDVAGHRPEQDTEVEARFKLKVGVTSQGIRNR